VKSVQLAEQTSYSLKSNSEGVMNDNSGDTEDYKIECMNLVKSEGD